MTVSCEAVFLFARSFIMHGQRVSEAIPLTLFARFVLRQLQPCQLFLHLMTKSELLLILQSDMIDAIDIFLIEQIDGTGIDHAFRIQAGTVIIDGPAADLPLHPAADHQFLFSFFQCHHTAQRKVLFHTLLLNIRPLHESQDLQ